MIGQRAEALDLIAERLAGRFLVVRDLEFLQRVRLAIHVPHTLVDHRRLALAESPPLVVAVIDDGGDHDAAQLEHDRILPLLLPKHLLEQPHPARRTTDAAGGCSCSFSAEASKF